MPTLTWDPPSVSRINKGRLTMLIVVAAKMRAMAERWASKSTRRRMVNRDCEASEACSAKSGRVAGTHRATTNPKRAKLAAAHKNRPRYEKRSMTQEAMVGPTVQDSAKNMRKAFM